MEAEILDCENMSLEELVRFAKSTDDSIKSFEQLKNNIEETLKLAQEQRAKIFARLLTIAKEKHIKDEKVNDLFVTYFSKEEITWLDDAGLLAALMKNGATEFIKTVTTTKESVDKKELKKAFNRDTALKESYKDFYGTKLTEYVTVTTEENHNKMFEHMEEHKDVK